MKTYSLLQIGEYHTNFCEDALFSSSFNDDVQILAVMDGCSSGKESHFASTLFTKFLKKEIKEVSYKEYFSKSHFSLIEIQKRILEGLFNDLKAFKNQNHLETIELLSTLVLGVINKSSGQGEIIVIGDGVICHDGKIYEFEQDNHPDYLAYHLEENFEAWYTKQSQFLKFEKAKRIAISTDGVFTFKKLELERHPQISSSEILNFILINNEGNESQKMLFKKILDLKEKFGLTPMDDLGILRATFKDTPQST